MNKWPKWKSKLEKPLIEGGLRLNGLQKNGTKDHLLISYVTVVKNNENTISRVIESVQRQSYDNIEHIVIDGASTDNTLEIILKYKDVIDYYASEQDNGIYDALNKAIELCNGQLILVLNSDDWLTNDSSQYAANKYDFKNPHLISGTANVLIDGNEIMEWRPKVVTLNSYFSVANINHNSIYASREAYELSGEYDSSYTIAADFKWIMSCFNSGIKFIYTDKVLVNYSLGGISKDVFWHKEECKRVIKERFPFLDGGEVVALNYLYYPFRQGFKYPFVGFEPHAEIKNILKKYSNNEVFIAAIDLENKFIKKKFNDSINPIIYKVSRFIYHIIGYV
jgi:glycosyltransferase involved in cell wall biosynthesis